MVDGNMGGIHGPDEGFPRSKVDSNCGGTWVVLLLLAFERLGLNVKLRQSACHVCLPVSLSPRLPVSVRGGHGP